MSVLVVSPHCDDACLSLGQFIAATAKVTVVTVFAGIPTEGLSDYDAACGFTSSAEAMQVRREEDRAACQILGAEVVHLDFLDQQYKHPAYDVTLAETLAKFYRPDWLIFVPLGIGHPDHAQTARCARAARGEGTLVSYEEAPYRALFPEQVVDALDKIRADGWAIADLPYPLEQGSRDQKIAAVSAYRSQFRDAEAVLDPCIYVPERCHRMAR